MSFADNFLQKQRKQRKQRERGIGQRGAARRMLALCSGRPVSSKQTRAKAATPSRMTSLDGNAKQSRRCDLVAPGLHDHSGPGVKTTPALAAGATSLVTSTRSGSLSHKKMPPLGFHI